MRLSIIGTGYVGLTAGTCLADSGNDVTCVDVDAEKVHALSRGTVPFYEPGLSELVQKNLAARRLSFSTDLASSVERSQVVFIAVGTPEAEAGRADVDQVLAVSRQVARAIRRYTTVVNKSTVPVGMAERVKAEMEKLTKVPFDVVSNPEFLKEGAALEDFQRPDRVVVGTDSERARQLMAELYAPFVRTGAPILFMDSRSAEVTKYAANAMLATRISFINDMALLCEKVGADVDFVRRGMGTDRRIGSSFLFPGVGYGGSCFPKDVKALLATAQDHGLSLDLLEAVERTNARQKRVLLEKASRHFGNLRGRTFGVWGLSFKPKTDDMREAPSVDLVEGLLEAGAQLVAHDPAAGSAARRRFGDRIRLADHPYGAVEGVDALFLLTEWNEFRHPDFERMKALMKSPVVFDGRNVLDPRRMAEMGFIYFGIGRRGVAGAA